MPLGQQMEGRATSSGLDSPVRTKVAIVTGASRGIGRGIAEQHRRDSIHQLEQKSQSSLAHQEALAAESQNGFLRRGTAWLQTREISHRPKRCSPEIV